MQFGDLTNPVELKKLNGYLSSRSYVEGYSASSADVDLYNKLGNNVSQTEYVHIYRWYSHISALLARNAVQLKPDAALSGSGASAAAAADTKTAAKGASKKAASPAVKPAPAPASPAKKPAAKPAAAAAADDAEDDDFNFDMDAEDDDDEEERMAALRAKADALKKDTKDKPVAKSTLVLDVKPEESDTDMKEVERAVRAITMDGLVWGAAELKPVAFGIKKLQIIATIVDDLVSVDELQESIEALPGVQSMDIFAFNKV